MKIAPSLCLFLAFFSPAVALRGSRRLQDEEEVEEPVEEPVEEEDAEESLTYVAGLPELSKYVPPTPAPTPASTGNSPGGAGGGGGGGGGGHGNKPAAEVKETFEVSEYAMYSQEARKGKSGSYSKDSKDSYDPPAPDSLCQDFCQRYMSTCEGANAFFNPDMPRGTTAGRRRLIEGTALAQPRLGGSVFDSLDDCHYACMGYPRPTDPADYLDPTFLGVNSIGDTFWCRNTHLRLAESKTEHFSAQVHCPFASPSGGGLCTNVIIDSAQQPGNNATAYEFIRAGSDTSRHLGFCQMYFNDMVADCTSAGVNDVNFPLVLALIPTETEIIILNNNVGKRDPLTGNTIGDGITMIKDFQFRDLLCTSCIKALIIDDGDITTLGSSAFTALPNLEMLSLNMQLISTLPSGLLRNNGNLRDFSIYNTQSKPGLLSDGSLPGDLFDNSRGIQRIVISGHRRLSELPPLIFNRLFSLTVLILSNNGFTNRGIIQPLMFQSLSSLQIWDMSNNHFTIAPKEWVNTGWARNLTNFYLHDNSQLEKLEDGIFDYFDNGVCQIEVVTAHNTNMKTINPGLFDFCQESLISFTLSNGV